jgi:hypothetical protein
MCLSFIPRERDPVKGKGKGKFASVLNQAPHHEDISRNEFTVPCILNLSPRLKKMVSFMPWMLYPQGKSPRHSLDKRLGA